MITLPRLYAVLDASKFPDTRAICVFAEELVAGGLTLLQYRNKNGSAREMLEQSRELKRHLPNSVQLIMNDRADLCIAAGFDGVHVGQDDLSPAGARVVVGNERWIGLSTHNAEQLAAADVTDINYVAIGPVFATSTKERPDPVVGLDGVRRARAATRKPLVAIGGITRANCRSVIEAGADCVAVVSDPAKAPRAATQEFLRLMR